MKYWIKPGIFLPLCQESPCFPPQAAPDSPQLQNDVWNKTLRIITIIYPESLHQRLWFKKFQKISKLLSSRDRAEGLHRKMDFVLFTCCGELRYIGNQSNTYEGVNNDVLPWEKLSVRMFSICFLLLLILWHGKMKGIQSAWANARKVIVKTHSSKFGWFMFCWNICVLCYQESKWSRTLKVRNFIDGLKCFFLQASF